MQLKYLLPAVVSLASAQSVFETWNAAGPDDLRSPCPALNSLANHGILPHDGKNITVAKIVTALSTLNVSAEVATILGMAGLKTSSDPASGTFTLDNLKLHNAIEHDGSLTRKDTAEDTGSVKQMFDQSIYDEYEGYFNGSTDITIALAAKARWGRLETARKQNPSFSYGPGQRFNSYAETGVMFNVLQDPTTGTVPLNRIKALFTEERFPYTEGWRPISSTNGFSVGNIMVQVALNTPEDPIKDLVMPTA